LQICFCRHYATTGPSDGERFILESNVVTHIKLRQYEAAILTRISKALHFGIALTLGLMAFGALRFPGSIKNGGLTSAGGSCLALIAYATVTVWVQRSSDKTLLTAMKDGAKFGGVITVFAIIGHSLEQFANLRPPFPAILGVSMWGVMFLLFGGACSVTYRKTGSMGLGILASVWSAFASTIGTIVFAFAVGLIFMAHMERFLAPAFAVSGMTDPSAFVIRNMFDSAFARLFVAPIAAVIVAIASGMACAILRYARRQTAMLLGFLNVVLLGAGIASLQWASYMERPARPPFIMFGLCALGVTLASVYPLIVAIRRPGLIENQ
jgi:hypothetical protein